MDHILNSTVEMSQAELIFNWPKPMWNRKTGLNLQN